MPDDTWRALVPNLASALVDATTTGTERAVLRRADVGTRIGYSGNVG